MLTWQADRWGECRDAKSLIPLPFHSTSMERDTTVRPLLPSNSSHSSSSLWVDTIFDDDNDDNATKDHLLDASSTSVIRFQSPEFGASFPRNRSPDAGIRQATQEEQVHTLREENRRRRGDGDLSPPAHRPSGNLPKTFTLPRHSRSFSPVRTNGHNFLTTARPRTHPKQRGITRPVLVTSACLFCWYALSTGLSLYNKWLFGKKHYAFEFPLFVTGIHMCVQSTFASLILAIAERLRPERRPSTRTYCTRVVPCGLATGFDIGLSNSSMKTISLAFYTMCKSSSLVWIVLFAFVFRLEKPRLSLIGVITLISIGVFMMVMDEATFVLIGFVEVMTAAMFGGLRWSLTQILLERDAYGIGNPIAAMFFLAPIMASSLFIASGVMEGYGVIFQSHFFATSVDTMHTLSLIVLGGVLASLMLLSELYLIAQTSVVTLSVAGIFKEVVTILVSSAVYGDPLTIINIAGLCVSLAGIAAYNYIKASQGRENSFGDESIHDDPFVLDGNGYSQIVERNGDSIILIDKISRRGEEEEVVEGYELNMPIEQRVRNADEPRVSSRPGSALLDKR